MATRNKAKSAQTEAHIAFYKKPFPPVKRRMTSAVFSPYQAELKSEDGLSFSFCVCLFLLSLLITVTVKVLDPCYCFKLVKEYNSTLLSTDKTEVMMFGADNFSNKLCSLSLTLIWLPVVKKRSLVLFLIRKCNLSLT